MMEEAAMPSAKSRLERKLELHRRRPILRRHSALGLGLL